MTLKAGHQSGVAAAEGCIKNINTPSKALVLLLVQKQALKQDAHYKGEVVILHSFQMQTEGK